jgi:hypothetical protein
VRRSALLKRGCLRPVELIHAKHPDRDALEAKLASLFDKYDRDGDGALNEKEFNNLVRGRALFHHYHCFSCILSFLCNPLLQ